MITVTSGIAARDGIWSQEQDRVMHQEWQNQQAVRDAFDWHPFRRRAVRFVRRFVYARPRTADDPSVRLVFASYIIAVL